MQREKLEDGEPEMEPVGLLIARLQVAIALGMEPECEAKRNVLAGVVATLREQLADEDFAEVMRANDLDDFFVAELLLRANGDGGEETETAQTETGVIDV